MSCGESLEERRCPKHIDAKDVRIFFAVAEIGWYRVCRDANPFVARGQRGSRVVGSVGVAGRVSLGAFLLRWE